MNTNHMNESFDNEIININERPAQGLQIAKTRETTDHGDQDYVPLVKKRYKTRPK